MDADGGSAAEQVHRTVEAVWRIEAGRLIAALARVTGDVGTAEEVAQVVLMVVANGYVTGQTIQVNGGAHFT
jgi:NAD(P)-dependent dehydrogenase (short-subunit alcohol dehydrogenase family)